jgi:hypothetical protein
MIYQDFVRFRRGHHALWSAILVVAAGALYATEGGRQRPGGGTWQGYVLGTIGVVLILWLSLLGVRKRCYSSTLGSVQGWTSAHVWLGLALIFVATAHCAGLFGWNIHTLSYFLMCAVIASGIVGVYYYLVTPRRISANGSGLSRPQLFAELLALDREGLRLAGAADPGVGEAVRSSIERTSIGGGLLRQLLGTDRSLFLGPAPDAQPGGRSLLQPNTDQQAVLDLIAARIPEVSKRVEVSNLQELLILLTRRQAVLRRIRRDVQLQSSMQLWLFVHVPLTFALFAALLVHILATFMYW